MKKSFVLFLLIQIFHSISYSQIAGPLTGNSVTIITIPGSSQTWQNPGNVSASDNIYSTFGSIAVRNGYTDYLVVSNFGFTIPNGSEISGIVVEVERLDVNSMTIDNSIRLVKGGSIAGDEKAVSAAYPTSDAYQTYGNAGDTWGLSWTAADINAANFGIAVSARKINANNGTAAGKIDNIIITVYYDFVSLPVDLISFSATGINKIVSLNWKTANEINMIAYEVQRSTDGINFSSITTVPCQNLTSISQYHFEDVHPSGNILFYRLRMTGLSGYIKYSKIISVKFDNENRISLFPNPVVPGGIIRLSGRNNQLLTIRFYNPSGQIVSSQLVESDELSLSSLQTQKGIIFYQMINSTGQIAGTGKLIIE